jgi:hypothetical protein
VGSGANERGRRGDSIPYLTYRGNASRRSNFAEEDATAVCSVLCGLCSVPALVAVCCAPGQGGCGCRRGAVLRQEREGAGAALEGRGRTGAGGVLVCAMGHSGTAAGGAAHDRTGLQAVQGGARLRAVLAAQGQRRRHLFVDVQEEGEQGREEKLGPATWAVETRCAGSHVGFIWVQGLGHRRKAACRKIPKMSHEASFSSIT